jgi:hypothetical protein
MKFLTICEGGAVRSVAFAAVIRWDFHQDALPVSAAKNSPETIAALCDWADRIVPMEAKFADVVPSAHKHKIKICDVGPDVWFNSFDRKLRDLCGEFIEAWARQGWAL